MGFDDDILSVNISFLCKEEVGVSDESVIPDFVHYSHHDTVVLARWVLLMSYFDVVKASRGGYGHDEPG